MTTSSLALQEALYAALTTNTDLLYLLGGANVFDAVPRNARYPYVTIGQSTVRDWSTATEDGDEHILTLHVWSRARGGEETQAIMSAARMALVDVSPTLTGHRLINLRHVSSEARREADGETCHGLMRLRAVTEPTL
jgi:hypothetical protein